MGLFDRFKSKQIVLGAVAKGTFVPMEEIPDAVFSQGILGKCCGIDPQDGKICAPADGEVSQLTDTLHALGLTCGGVEVLIHAGVDTVEMKGDGFAVLVREGQTVKRGDALMTMDLQKVRDAGHPATVIVAVTNTDDLGSVEIAASGTLQPGDELMRIRK